VKCTWWYIVLCGARLGIMWRMSSHSLFRGFGAGIYCRQFFASSLLPWSFLLGLSSGFSYVSWEGAEGFCPGAFNLRLSRHMPFRCDRKLSYRYRYLCISQVSIIILPNRPFTGIVFRRLYKYYISMHLEGHIPC